VLLRRPEVGVSTRSVGASVWISPTVFKTGHWLVARFRTFVRKNVPYVVSRLREIRPCSYIRKWAFEGTPQRQGMRCGMTAITNLDDEGLEAAADCLYAARLHHHRWPDPPQLPTCWRDLDPVGRSEFVGIVEETIQAYLLHLAS